MNKKLPLSFLILLFISVSLFATPNFTERDSLTVKEADKPTFKLSVGSV